MRTAASNALVVVGSALVIYGTAQWSVPAALVVAGVASIVAAINLVRR